MSCSYGIQHDKSSHGHQRGGEMGFCNGKGLEEHAKLLIGLSSKPCMSQAASYVEQHGTSGGDHISRKNSYGYASDRESLASSSSSSDRCGKRELLENIRLQNETFKSMDPKMINSKLPNYSNDKTKNNYESQVQIQPNKLKFHPKLRVGPVYTTLFNSTVNEKEKYTRLDLNQLYSYLPKKSDADILVARYRASVHPLIPVLDWQLFYPTYENFWNNPSAVDVSFYVILFTVLYASSVSLFEENIVKPDERVDKEELIGQMKFYVGTTEIALAMAEYPKKVTITGLQSSVILFTLVRNDCRTDDFLSISSLVRCAQLIELNRDPLNYHRVENTKEIQQKRILWWQIFYLDCTTALSTKLAPLINENECDTEFPNEYKRHYNGDFMLDQAIAFANGRFKWVLCTNRILKASFNIKLKLDQILLKISRDVEILSFFCSSLIQRMLDPINIMPYEEMFVKFASYMLSTFTDRCHILVHILFQKESENKKDYNESLVNGIDNSEEGKKVLNLSSISDVGNINLNDELYLKHVHLLTEFIKYGEMPKYSLFVWEIRKFQPIQTLLILLRNLVCQFNELYVKYKDNNLIVRHLKEQPSVKIIDDALDSLNFLSEHTTELCKQRWGILKNLKAIIWWTLFEQNRRSSEYMIDKNYKLAPYDSTIKESNILLNNSSPYNDDESSVSWDEIYKEMNDLQTIIEDNINMQIWDNLSGHYV